MAIKIHPIQDRLRHGKSIPLVKEKHHAVDLPEAKGKFQGLCNVRACLAPGAVFYNSGSRAYYCRECALAIHDASRMNLDWMHERMIQLETTRPSITMEEVETVEDIEHLYNCRAEAKMALQWAQWQQRRLS